MADCLKILDNICFSIAISYLESFFQETAHEKKQKFKEGKSVLERSVKTNLKFGETLKS